ncbi:MAG: HAD family hydrolase [Sulfolobales archaeon]|nr:HAD family hydrolase [Sulfolobales archaeon]MCX8198675.1 HAD family hydrolase [Sulfolobales archaeon]MDW8169748.1 HAD family hydrolase [Desulfurococcaceae archaeon]
MTIKVISFDVWDTLLNLNTYVGEVVSEISRLTGAPYAEVMNVFMNLREFLKSVRRSGSMNPHSYLSFSQELIAKSLRIDVDCVRRAIVRAALNVDVRELVVTGVNEVLAELRDSSSSLMIIIGNTMIWPSTITRLLIERVGIASYFTKQYYSDETGFFKPFKEAFYEALKDLGIHSSEALHVGDQVVEDYEGALKAGLYAILIDRGLSLSKGAVIEGGRGYRVKSIVEVPRVIKLIT